MKEARFYQLSSIEKNRTSLFNFFLKPEGDSYVPISNQLVLLIAKVTQNTKDKQNKPCIPIHRKKIEEMHPKNRRAISIINREYSRCKALFLQDSN